MHPVHKVSDMGILCDKQIKDEVRIDPFANGVKRRGEVSYGLSSYGYDVRIGTRFKVFMPPLSCTKQLVVDPKAFSEDFVKTVDTEREKVDHILIPPNSFALGETLEFFTIPRNVLAICVGKSTYARCGIIVNVTPLEPEWCGRITMEISNTTPLPAKIYAGEGIAQILFFRAERLCEVSYADKHGKYQNQSGLALPCVD